MPDNKWWQTESMRYDASGQQLSYKCPNPGYATIYNRPNVACPSGWRLPYVSEFNHLVNTATLINLKSTNACPGTDYYGYDLNTDSYWRNLYENEYPSGDCQRYINTVGDKMFDTADGLRYHFFRAANDIYTMNCNVYGYLDRLSWNEVRCVRQF
jgi:hypothetical protein